MHNEIDEDDDFVDDDWIFDVRDSEIDGDCNESQPCRGDEPWLDEGFLTLTGEQKQRSAHSAWRVRI